MATAAQQGRIEVLTPEQGRLFLEERIREAFHIGLDEFIQRWQDGTYGDVDDNPAALELAMLLPVVGVDPWSNGSRT